MLRAGRESATQTRDGMLPLPDGTLGKDRLSRDPSLPQNIPADARFASFLALLARITMQDQQSGARMPSRS